MKSSSSKLTTVLWMLQTQCWVWQSRSGRALAIMRRLSLNAYYKFSITRTVENWDTKIMFLKTVSVCTLRVTNLGL